MNYEKIYHSLITKRKKYVLYKSDDSVGVIECHHIIPMSCGGTNNNDNKINLTCREHYIAHLLLWKIHKEDEFGYKMLCAVKRMQVQYVNRKFKFNSRLYEHIRIEHARFVSKRLKNLNTGVKNSQYGKCWIYNAITHENKKISMDDPLPNGWRYGRYMSMITNLSRKKSAETIRGYRWITNEYTNKHINKNESIPDGWRIGITSTNRIERQKSVHTSKKEHYTKMYNFLINHNNDFELMCKEFNFTQSRGKFFHYCRHYFYIPFLRSPNRETT